MTRSADVPFPKWRLGDKPRRNSSRGDVGTLLMKGNATVTQIHGRPCCHGRASKPSAHHCLPAVVVWDRLGSRSRAAPAPASLSSPTCL